jgi:hypothetical protein
MSGDGINLTRVNPGGTSNSAGSSGPASNKITSVPLRVSECFSLPSGRTVVVVIVSDDLKANPVSLMPRSMNSGFSDVTDVSYRHDFSFLQTTKEVHGVGYLRGETRR